MPNIVEILITGTDKFSEVGKKVNEEVEKLGKSSTSMGEKAGKALDLAGKATLALGSAALAGIGKAVEEYVKYGEQVRKVQQLTGATAEDASHLVAAAEETGVEFDTLSRALGLFSKNMLIVQEQDAGFTSSLNTNEKVLKSIGIAALDASGNIRPLPELLGDVADKFQHMSNSGEKVGLAMQLFGRNGTAMLPFLNQGREGIAALNEEADKLGVTLSQKQVDAAHQFTLSQRQMQESLKGVEISLASKVLPGLTQFTNALKEGMESGDKFHKLMQGVAFALAAIWFDAMGLIANQVESVLERLVKAAVAALNFIAEKANSVSNLVPVVGRDIAPTINADNFHIQRSEMTDPLEGLRRLFPDITKPTKDFGDAAQGAVPPLQDFTKNTKSASDTLKDGMDLLKSAQDELFNKPTIERATANLNFDKLQMSVDRLTDKFQPAIDKLDDFKQSVSDAKDKLSDWGDDISRRKTIVSDAQQSVQDRIDALKEQQGDLNSSNDPGGKIKQGMDAQLNYYERQLKGTDLANRALDKEERERQRQDKALDETGKNVDKQKATIERQIALAQRQLDSQGRITRLDDDKEKIMRDELTLADATLMTDKQRDQVYQQLLIDTRNVSTRIGESASKLKDGLLPSIGKVHDVAMASGDVLQILKNLQDKQNGAAAAADRLTTSLDGASTAVGSKIPGMLNDIVKNIFSVKPGTTLTNGSAGDPRAGGGGGGGSWDSTLAQRRQGSW